MKKYIVVGVVTLAVLFVTLFIPQTITEHGQLKQITCGFPFHFMTEDDSFSDPPLPLRELCIFISQATVTDPGPKILWIPFASSFLIVYLIIYGAFTSVQRLMKRQRGVRA